jgi:hypothetical protein
MDRKFIVELAIALAGKLALAAAFAFQLNAEATVPGLIAAGAAVTAVLSVATGAAGSINEVVGARCAGGITPHGARAIGAAVALSALAHTAAAAVVGTVAAAAGGAYAAIAVGLTVAYMLDVPVMPLLRVMRKQGARGRLWGLWSALGYALPLATGSAALLAAEEVTAWRMSGVLCISAVVGALPCAVWARRNNALAMPTLADLRSVVVEAAPMLAESASSAACKVAVGALLTRLALAAPTDGDMWGGVLELTATCWMIAAQLGGVAGDRVQRALGTEGEAAAWAEFRRVMAVSAVAWLAIAFGAASVYGVPAIWALATLPKLGSALATRRLEAARRWADLARCGITANAVTLPVAALAAWCSPDHLLLHAVAGVAVVWGATNVAVAVTRR